MEKYHGFDQASYEYLFGKITKDGGLRMQVIASDIGMLPSTQLISSKRTILPRILSISTASNTATSSRHSRPSKISPSSSSITWSSKWNHHNRSDSSASGLIWWPTIKPPSPTTAKNKSRSWRLTTKTSAKYVGRFTTSMSVSRKLVEESLTHPNFDMCCFKRS